MTASEGNDLGLVNRGSCVKALALNGMSNDLWLEPGFQV